MKILLLALTLIISTTVLAQPLLIGTVRYDPPFEIEADSQKHVMGFDMDLMNEICQHLNRKCEYVFMPFPELFPAVLTQRIQLAIAAINITNARSQQFLFSTPYLLSSARFITRVDEPIQNIEGIKGKKIGVLKDSVYSTSILQKYKDSNEIVTFSSSPNELQAIYKKNIDLILTDAPIASYWVSNNSQFLKYVGKAIPYGDGYGIMLNKQETQLTEQINKALFKMEADGSYLNIYQRYF